MAKVSKEYLEIDPWRIVEKGFKEDYALESESIFALANEYMGVRGYFEENYSGKKHVGSFFNGVYEYREVKHPQVFKGFIDKEHFLVNAVNWLKAKIWINNQLLDLHTADIRNFERVLDMRTGTLTRNFELYIDKNQVVSFSFQRFLDMQEKYYGFQKIEFKPINFECEIKVELITDYGTVHKESNKNYWDVVKCKNDENHHFILGKTKNSKQKIISGYKWFSNLDAVETKYSIRDKQIGSKILYHLLPNQSLSLKRVAINIVSRSEEDDDHLMGTYYSLISKIKSDFLSQKEIENKAYWKAMWEQSDIYIEGDDQTQQGIRFCIFHLHQAYHGVDPSLNISAKGLTGEAYCGWTWWDTETYCLPFYLFSNPKAAKNLLLYRYNKLPNAIKRAEQKDCEGARYPMGTINGDEAVGTWQHGDLEIHVSAAVAYGIWHYVKVSGDKTFLYKEGIEMLIEICRYYASRGQWAQKTKDFGFWGVMGPDEFAMMVHNNYYTNYMVKKAFLFTLEMLDMMKKDQISTDINELKEKVNLNNAELENWENCALKMRLPADDESGILEQYDGFFNMPHINYQELDDKEFPLYKNWAYYRIFRNDMIKQPDVLLLFFLYSTDFDIYTKAVNYNYYEPRCCHESSLSPCIHSILAAELGKEQDALNYAKYAFRIDLDNYNNNTHEGTHNTSMAGAWLTIVYGFAGMRSDGNGLIFNPYLPSYWKKYRFKIRYNNSVIQIEVCKDDIEFSLLSGDAIMITVYDKPTNITKEKVRIPLKQINE